MKFAAELIQTGNNTGIEVPQTVLAALGGGKRPRVRVVLNGFAFSLTLGSMKGKVMIPVSAERRAAAGVVGGNTYDIVIALDNTPDAIDPPADFTEALDRAGLRAAFESLAPSHRKEHVHAITEAKTAETRARRIDKAVAMIQEKAK